MQRQLTIKTLQGKKFTIDVIDTAKIADVKDQISKLEDAPVSLQKLIHSGKILSDDAVVGELNIKETDFFVLMISKPKPVAPPPVVTPAPAPSASSAPVPTTTSTTTPAATTGTDSALTTPSLSAPTPASTPATGLPPAAPAVLDQTFDASTLATGTAYQAAVNNLVEMGFPKSEVERAMRAAFNNPDRAAEYLMTGIPENIQPLGGGGGGASRPATATAPVTGGAATATAGADSTAAATGTGDAGYVNLFTAGAAAAATAPPSGGDGTAAPGGAAGLEVLARIAESPQFQQIRQLVQTQPHLLEPILQQIGANQPELLQVITQNQDAFLQMLNVGGDVGGAGLGLGGGGDDDDADYEDDEMTGAGGADAPGGTQRIAITPEDDASINRLTALGFTRVQAAQAYFACDKNEELAANFLFESGGFDD